MTEPNPERISLSQLYDEMMAVLPDEEFDVESGLADLHRRIMPEDEA